MLQGRRFQADGAATEKVQSLNRLQRGLSAIAELLVKRLHNAWLCLLVRTRCLELRLRSTKNLNVITPIR